MSIATATATITSSPLIDVRSLAPSERHPRIFQTFRDLAPGQGLALVNDHDLQPLRGQFQILLPGQFAWTSLEAGPAIWRVSITKIALPPLKSPCCGACGGA